MGLPDGEDNADLSPDDSPWSYSAWSEDDNDDEGSLSLEDSGEGSDGLEEENNADSDDAAVAEESDSSEDEVASRNTVGNVPLEWYKDEEHIGYNLAGRKIKKRDREGFVDDAGPGGVRPAQISAFGGVVPW